MVTFLFYMVVITLAVVFLLSVAHDEVTAFYDAVMDMFHHTLSRSK
ncbi:MAG TPA: hypothetical protein PKH78_04460 [Candidatus Obscuribacter sp.]|nr:hypothetical protein [Candidatus Obscuribacter sp.]MBL8086180.1 hypothetical protein [Candidatus Obscuribacter sp.]MDX1989185.1 hypothetical protein [Candidatus Obscuribacter sp.]HMX46258.1 hypothetical protein [Candidatus Obscuribacter sp.]HNG75992.1 hypothetical protein [Candidatus Obscuribacter sp.]